PLWTFVRRILDICFCCYISVMEQARSAGRCGFRREGLSHASARMTAREEEKNRATVCAAAKRGYRKT
ncbi:MAG: hypothetical protein WCH57_06730, partial [Verrucomicrobiota bacterium]